jgi:hypothetical protein
MNTIARGTVAELMVSVELSKKEMTVCLPLNHNSEYDLVADTENGLRKIQVKRAYSVDNHGTKVLCVETRRILVKHSGKKGSVAGKYSDNGYDFLIACDVDNHNFWIIPRDKTAQYKAQIYLTKGMEQYLNQWILLGN